MLPSCPVWLKRVDFEVDPGANSKRPFRCHITVTYSKDLYDKLQGMTDSKHYFEQVENLKKVYKDSIEIFNFDLVPGKNRIDQKISLTSYTKAKGAFIFAKYETPGKFMESIGMIETLTVRFLPSKMETHSNLNLDSLTAKLNSR